MSVMCVRLQCPRLFRAHNEEDDWVVEAEEGVVIGDAMTLFQEGPST